jgi:ABC-type antimicrobial peptide transport system permease subunit
LWEGIVLATISFVFASIGIFIITNLLNNIIMSGTDLLLTPFIIGIRQFAVMLILVYLIVFISSVIPIIKSSRMKPIDAILNK